MFFVDRPFDSHIHLSGVGEILSAVDLKSIQSAGDFKKLNLSKSGAGVVRGFGWHFGQDQVPLGLKTIDELWPQQPCFFSRADGHASLVNSAAAKLLGLSSTSVFLEEREHFSALKKLATHATASEKKESLLRALNHLQQKGFTHFRDMTTSVDDFNAFADIFESNPQAYVECFFPIHQVVDFESIQVQLESLRARASKYLRLQGLKIFIDGTLGAQTAHTRCFCQSGKTLLWSTEELEKMTAWAWNQNLDVAFHCIGEDAVEKVVDVARKVMLQGATGRLHIEHCELIKKSTLAQLKGLHVSVHMQPSHLIDDWKILQEVNEDQDLVVFPAENLRKLGIPLYFGSDAPVVSADFKNTQKGISMYSQKITKFSGEWLKHHSHPSKFSPSSRCVLDEDLNVKELWFEEKKLI